MLSRQLPISPADGQSNPVHHGQPTGTTATPAGSRRRSSSRWRFNDRAGGDRRTGTHPGGATRYDHRCGAVADRFQSEPLDAKFSLGGGRPH
ncbi:hypothetical protein GCM10017710_47510 [Arthrobacter ramosus]